jgi:pimeloyl-ACP methyl ester carboxylesterase
MKVIVADHYAVVASLLQGLVVVDLNAVTSNSAKVDLELVGVSQVEPGITVPIAGPIGTSFTEDSADARCEPGRPQMVAGVWDASGQLRTPFDMKVYGAQALVGDYHAGTYHVYLDSLPAIDGGLLSRDPTFRLDVLPNVEIVNTEDQSKRTTSIAVIASGKMLTLVDVRDGTTLGRTSISGTAFNVLVDSERRLVLVGTDSCVELFDITILDKPVSRGCNPKINSATGGLAMLGPYVVASTAGGAVVVQIVQPPIDIKLYDAQGFGPTYDRRAQALQFTGDLTDIPLDGKEMVGAQADGVSLLVVRASIPDNSRAKDAILTVTTPQGNSWSAATFGGLYSEWPSASAVRGAQGRQRIVVPIKEVKNGARTEKVAVAIYHPPTKFAPDGDGLGASRRQITVTVQTNEDHPLDGGRAVRITRRPLVLVHGYNSGPGTWGRLTTGLSRAENVHGLTVMNVVNYEDINTYGLDLIYKRIPPALDKIRAGLKDSQISATRFDILAHSTGGLATWTYVSDMKDVLFSRNLMPTLARAITRSEQEYFRRSANYGVGTINQIISIGTPYRGSDLADRILAFLKCADTYQEIQGCAPRSLSDTLPQTLLEAFLQKVVTKWQGNGDRSAYADLAASSLSDETSALGRLWGSTPTGVPIHTIAGIAYDSVGCSESIVEATRMEWTLPYGSSDLIVDSQSAKGGLTGDYTEAMGGVCHTEEPGVRLIMDRPGQPAPLPPLVNDLTSDGKFYPQGLPAR